jgi:hypothetical protein
MEPLQAGVDSPIFGGKFPYPFDGKTVLLDIARQFASEFNTLARSQLRQAQGDDRAALWQPLGVTSAYPTTQQQCPRIAILRLGSTPKASGLGLEWHEEKVQLPNGVITIRKQAGQVITDSLEAAICTINERLRDDLHIWFQQYIIDAALWAIPQLRNVGFYELTCTNAADDQVEYQGGAAQPGFEFYVSRLTFSATYDLVVFQDVDAIKNIFNWELLQPGGMYTGAAGDGLEQVQTLTPPDGVFLNHDDPT